MRVALCISGQPRSALETFPFINENIIKPNNADVFLHMHFSPENLYVEKSYADNGNCCLQSDIDKKLIELYNPKSYLVEPPRNFNKQNIKIDNDRIQRSVRMNKSKNWSDEYIEKYALKQITSMYYSIYKCNELKELYANENGIIYDYVIRLRFDALPLDPISCVGLDPDCIHYLNINQTDEMISDWINIGSNAIMNVYSSQYLLMDYFNTFKFDKIENRISNVPPDRGGLCEHLTRDVMHLFKIPKKLLAISNNRFLIN